MNSRTVCRAAGYVALASVSFYAITGMGWWTPIQGPDDIARGMVLALLHAGGLLAGLMSLDEIWWK